MRTHFPVLGKAWGILAGLFLCGVLMAQEGASVVKYPDHNPIASTPIMNRRSGGRTQDLSGSVVGAKKLYLVVLPTEKYPLDNSAAWLEPRLVGPAGVKKLTELTPVATSNEGGPMAVDKTMTGRAFMHLGQPRGVWFRG